MIRKLLAVIFIHDKFVVCLVVVVAVMGHPLVLNGGAHKRLRFYQRSLREGKEEGNSERIVGKYTSPESRNRWRERMRLAGTWLNAYRPWVLVAPGLRRTQTVNAIKRGPPIVTCRIQRVCNDVLKRFFCIEQVSLN